jgi:lactoylglutathione lyase/glyoxylase I family protein
MTPAYLTMVGWRAIFKKGSAVMLPFPFPATNTASPFASMKSSHPCLRVPDCEAAVDWYVTAFDFRVVKRWPGPNGLRLAYLAAPGNNDSLIEIIGDAATDEGASLPEDFRETLGPCRYHHFAFSVRSHDRSLGTLAERGVRIVQQPFDVPELGYRVAFVADPWGNLIELVELADQA